MGFIDSQCTAICCLSQRAAEDLTVLECRDLRPFEGTGGLRADGSAKRCSQTFPCLPLLSAAWPRYAQHLARGQGRTQAQTRTAGARMYQDFRLDRVDVSSIEIWGWG